MILIVFYVSYHSQTHPLGILLELIEDGVVAELENEVQLSLSTKHLHKVDHDDGGDGDDDDGDDGGGHYGDGDDGGGDCGDGNDGYADNNDEEHGGVYMMMMNRMIMIIMVGTKMNTSIRLTMMMRMTTDKMTVVMMMMNTSIRLTRFGCFRFLSILQMDILTQGTQLSVHT